VGGFFDSSQQSLVVDSLHIVAALLLAVGVAPGLRGGACVNSGVWRPRDWSPIIAPHAARSLDCLRVVISYNIIIFCIVISPLPSPSGLMIVDHGLHMMQHVPAVSMRLQQCPG